MGFKTSSTQRAGLKLREHPLMSYRGICNWPPIWTWVGGEKKVSLKGEVGVLKYLKSSTVEPERYRLFLFMEYEEQLYIGCLLFDDKSFCHQIAALLQDYYNHFIKEIGDLEVSYTL